MLVSTTELSTIPTMVASMVATIPTVTILASVRLRLLPRLMLMPMLITTTDQPTSIPTTMVATIPTVTILESVRLRLLPRLMLMLMLLSTTALSTIPTLVATMVATIPTVTILASVRLRLLPRLMLMLMLVSTTVLSTIPTMVASMVATILTTFTASKETAKTDTVRIHRLPDLEIKLLSASALSSWASSFPLLLMLIWELELTFVHTKTKLESALAALKNPPLF